MIYSATITKTGQATIPKAIRDILGIDPGSNARIIYHTHRDGSVSITRDLTYDEARAYLDSYFSDKKSKELVKKHAGKSASQLIDEWLASPAGKAHLQEEYGN